MNVRPALNRPARQASQEKLGGAADGKDALRLELRLLTCAALVEQRISARFRDQFDMTLPRWDFMAALDRRGAASLTEVSRLLMTTNGNVSGIYARLRRDRLVEPCEGGRDRRMQFVRLTPEGQRRFRDMAAAHETWVEAMFAGLDATERDALLGLLDRARTSLKQEGAR